ncbi:MAG TPA: tetratricopeptide repeat protein, partial [Candidatus Dormibacteraeota bacterium]|nr:tetratricopeptide repeat protein [Candidatus Dormibacteraeota bacterium]
LGQPQFVSIALAHQSIDLAARLLDPEGTIKIQKEFTSKEKTDVLEFTAEKAAIYQIEITPEYPKARAGQYQIQFAELRTPTEKDFRVSKARELYSRSVELYRAATYDQALALNQDALELSEKALGQDNPEIAATLNFAGSICTAKGDYRRAETLYQQALTINEKAFGRSHLATAEVLDNLAINLSAQARYTDAENLAKEALAIREKTLGADHFLVAASLGTLAEIYLAKTDYQNAEVFAERAEEIAAKSYGPDDLAYSDFVSRLGRAHLRQGNYSRAEEVILQALHARETLAGKETLPVANSLTDLGALYLMKRDNVKCEQTLLQALSLQEKILGPNHPQVARILNNLGLIQYRRSDYIRAEALHLRALAIREKTLGPAHPELGQSLNNLGLVYWREGNYPKATEFYQRALDVQEKAYGPRSNYVALDLDNLGIMAKETGHYDVAESYYLRSLAIKEELFGKQNPEVKITVESLGILYRDKGNYVKAESMLLRALAISEASFGKDHPETARLLRNIEQLYEARGDAAKTLNYFQRIVAIDEMDLPLSLAVGSERQKLAYFDSFFGELEKLISFQALQDPHDPEASDLAATALIQRKGRVLDASADNLGALRNRANAEDRALLDQLREVTTQLATLVLDGGQRPSLEDRQKAIQSLKDQRDKLEAELSRRSMGYYQRSGAVTLAAVKAAIPVDAALVEFAAYRPYDPKQSFESGKRFGEPRYVAYVLTHEGDVRWKDLGAAKEINDVVEAFRQALRDPQRNDVRELSRSLDERLLHPVRALIGDASHLLLSPDGRLDLIPFEALLDEQNHFLVERYSITYLTTGRDLLRMQVPRPSRSAPVLVADPSFGEPNENLAANVPTHKTKATARTARRSITNGGDFASLYFAPLEGTKTEALSIQALFPEARVLTGEQASEVALEELNAPKILHIATHGFFLQDPAQGKEGSDATSNPENPLLRSGLALSGANLSRDSKGRGILTALQASNLDLWGTKLVTLSACDTGVGEVKNGEGVYGLRRAFFLAGTESLVMSLWPVSDYVTRELMTEYYRGLKKGLGRGEALRQAQLAMLKRKGRQHPFYWASFIQSGEWANLDGKR